MTKNEHDKALYLDGEVISVVENAGHLMITRIRYKEYTQSYFVYVRIDEAVFAHDLKDADLTQFGITDLVLSQHPGDYIVTWDDTAIKDLETIESDIEEVLPSEEVELEQGNRMVDNPIHHHYGSYKEEARNIIESDIEEE